MNSNRSTSSKLPDDATGTRDLAIDEPFDGDSTGVRPRTRLPLANDELCEELSQEDELPLPFDEFVLPTWEELTGLSRRVTTGRSFGSHPSSGRQQAIDLAEAEQRRRSTIPLGRPEASSSRRGEGGSTSQHEEAPLPWVERFERDMNARLGAPELEQADRVAALEERFPIADRSPGALSIPPPPPVPTLRSELPASPPSSRPISRPHVPSAYPANRPLPRFALGPRLEGLMGPERRPASARVPASLAPVAANDVRLHSRMNPWAAGLIGAVMGAAASFALFWSSEPGSRSATSVAAPVNEEALVTTETKVRRFEHETAQQLAAGAAERARACGMGKVPTEVGITFAPDGSVMSVAARGQGRLSEDTAYCMDESFSNLRIPPFEGKAREVRLTLR